jgi:predicted amidohydrolase
MVPSFTCAVVCPPPSPRAAETDPFNPSFSFGRAQRAARKAAESTLALAQGAAGGAGLVVLPEDIHQVRHFWRALEAPHMFRRLAEPIPGPTTKMAAQIARDHRVHLVLTLYENEGQRIFNTTVLFGPAGKVLARYRKTHLAPGEDWLVTPGDALTVVETALGRIGLACGEDYLFPETACVLARLAAEIVVCPSRCPLPELVLSSRSFESGMITILAQPDQSLLIDQRGSTLARSAGMRDYVLTARFVAQEPAGGERGELETTLTGIADGRKRWSGRRRPEVYGALTGGAWPEGARMTARQAEQRVQVAYRKLEAGWEEGMAPLPSWEG